MKFKYSNNNKGRKFYKKEKREFNSRNMKITTTIEIRCRNIGQYLSDFPIYKRVVANNFRRRWLIMTCTYKRHDQYRFPIAALASSSRKCASLANFRSEFRDFRAFPDIYIYLNGNEIKNKSFTFVAKSWRIIKKNIIFLIIKKIGIRFF